MPRLFTATDTKRPKPRRSQRQKLRDAVDDARGALELEPAGMWPTERRERLFADYSRAVHALVAHHLSAPMFDIEPESWSWDGYQLEFYFDYAGRLDLARSAENHHDADVMWCTARMRLDPKCDLDAELARIGKLASRYRERLEFLERETLNSLRESGGGPAAP